MDIFIYAIIAAVLIYRLYTVFGEKRDDEPQRPNPLARPPENNAPLFGARADKKPDDKKDDGKNAAPNNADVLAFPLTPPRHAAAQNLFQAEPAPASLAGSLHAIHQADPAFDEKQFTRGSRVAFEMIVHAFAEGERGALKNLMSGRIYEAFDAAITAREQAGERLEVRTLSLREADIIAARVTGDDAYVTVQFISEQRKITTRDATTTRDTGLEKITDIWTFRRNIQSTDPNWLLVETRSA